MIEAIYGAHALNGQIIEFFDKIVAECGKEKHEYEHFDTPEDLWNDMVIFHHTGSHGRGCFHGCKTGS